MLIQTAWTLTWGTVSILSLGDLLDGELRGPAVAGKDQPVSPARAPVGLAIQRGLVRFQLSFKRVVQFTTAEGAKNFSLAHALEIAGQLAQVGYAPDAQLVKIAGGAWTLGNCTCKASGIVRAMLYECDYTLDFGNLVVVTAPPDPDPAPVPINLATDTGATMVTDTGAAMVINP